MEDITADHVATILQRFLVLKSPKLEQMIARSRSPLSAAGGAAFCFACQAAFASGADLKRHIDTVCRIGKEEKNEGYNKYKCVRCNAGFNKAQLPHHIHHLDSTEQHRYRITFCIYRYVGTCLQGFPVPT